MLSNKVYDTLKSLDLVWLPALTTFYVTIDSIFGWGYGDVVAKVSAALCTLIGSLLGLSSSTYYRNLGDGIYLDGEEYDE